MYRLSVLKCPLTAYGLNIHPKIKKSVWQFCIAPAMKKVDDNFEKLCKLSIVLHYGKKM